MPIYLTEVSVGEHVEQHLVEAPNEARALAHTTRLHIKAEAIRSAEQIKAMAALAAKGLEIEQAESE